MQQFERDLAVLKKAAEMRDNNVSLRNISVSLGFVPSTSAKWFCNGKLPGKLHKLEKIKEFPRTPSLDLAYVFGVHTACQYSGNKGRVILRTAGSEVEDYAFQKLRRCYDRLWPGNHKDEGYAVGLGCRDIVRHFHVVTRHNNSVPWEHIGTDEERIEYLKGIFDWRGAAYPSENACSFSKTSIRLLQELRVLLFDFRILSNLSKLSKTYRITVYDSDLARLLELGVLPEHKRKKLVMEKPRDAANAYYTAWLYRDVLSYAEISERVGETKPVIAHWLGYGTRTKFPAMKEMPAAVQKYNKVRRASRILFDTKAVSFLYRTYPVHSSFARQLAEVIDCDDIRYTYSDRALPENISQLAEDVLRFKKDESIDYRGLKQEFLSKKSGNTLYQKVRAIRDFFGNEPRICMYFADIIESRHNIPSEIVRSWLDNSDSARQVKFEF